MENTKNKKETFGTNIGGGIGCFMVLLGIAIILYLPQVIALVSGCKK